MACSCSEPAWWQRQAGFLIRERKIVTPPAATTTLRTALVVRKMMQIAVFVEATAKPIAAQVRHREERSDAAIHVGLQLWIAAACGLAMTGLGLCRVSLMIEFFALKVAKRMRLTSCSHTRYFAEAMQAGAGRRFFACVMRSPAPACMDSGSAQ
jgi:hypothetical protein